MRQDILLMQMILWFGTRPDILKMTSRPSKENTGDSSDTHLFDLQMHHISVCVLLLLLLDVLE